MLFVRGDGVILISPPLKPGLHWTPTIVQFYHSLKINNYYSNLKLLMYSEINKLSVIVQFRWVIYYHGNQLVTPPHLDLCPRRNTRRQTPMLTDQCLIDHPVQLGKVWPCCRGRIPAARIRSEPSSQQQSVTQQSMKEGVVTKPFQHV